MIVTGVLHCCSYQRTLQAFMNANTIHSHAIRGRATSRVDVRMLVWVVAHVCVRVHTHACMACMHAEFAGEQAAAQNIEGKQP